MKPNACRFYSWVNPMFPRSTKTLQPTEGAQCAKGLDLSGPGAPMRCLPKPERQYETPTPCPMRENWTAEEIAAARADLDAAMTRAAGNMPLIPATGDGGTFACSVCGGLVEWRRAKSNGHVRARCSTPDCFFMVQ